jgi:hypothetical protein
MSKSEELADTECLDWGVLDQYGMDDNQFRASILVISTLSVEEK